MLDCLPRHIRRYRTISCGNLGVQVLQEVLIAAQQLVIGLCEVKVDGIGKDTWNILVVVWSLRDDLHRLVPEVHLDQGHVSRVPILVRGDDFVHGLLDSLLGVEDFLTSRIGGRPLIVIAGISSRNALGFVCGILLAFFNLGLSILPLGHVSDCGAFFHCG